MVNRSTSNTSTDGGGFESVPGVVQLPVPFESVSNSTFAPSTSRYLMRMLPTMSRSRSTAAVTLLASASHGCVPQSALANRTSLNTIIGAGNSLIVAFPILSSRPVFALTVAASEWASAPASSRLRTITITASTPRNTMQPITVSFLNDNDQLRTRTTDKTGHGEDIRPG